MDSRIASMQCSIRRLQLYAVGSTLAFGAIATAAFRPQTVELIRARGIIIEDAAGRERILIGAPIPQAANRLRTDTGRVRNTWAKRFPPTYMGYYRGYQHSMNGIVLLDSSGVDRVALGDPVPDPNIGRRIAPATGLVINDAAGFERTGYGVLTVGGKDRVNLGLDNASGEAVTLSVDDGGRIGIMAQDKGRTLWLGSSPADPALGVSAPFFGMLVRDGQVTRHELGVDTARH